MFNCKGAERGPRFISAEILYEVGRLAMLCQNMQNIILNYILWRKSKHSNNGKIRWLLRIAIFFLPKISFKNVVNRSVFVRFWSFFLAATKQFQEHFFPSVHLSMSVCLLIYLSVCPSVGPSHLFDNGPVIVSSWDFQKLLPLTDVKPCKRSRSEVKSQCQRSQNSA